MNSHDLELLCKRDAKLKVCFQGVFASDRLPEDITYPFACIVNSDPHHKPGEHWLAIFIEGPHVAAEIFDSYGLEPFGKIYKFANTHANGVVYSTKWIQSILSKVCGLYAYYFLHHRVRGSTLVDVSARFQAFDWRRNDDVIITWYLAVS